MTDQQLAQHCLELAAVREQARQLAERDDTLAGDIMDELARRGLNFVQFAANRRAEMDQPSSRTIEIEAFAALCKKRDVPLEDAAACITRRINISAANKLFSQTEIDSIATIKRGSPRLRIIDGDGQR